MTRDPRIDPKPGDVLRKRDRRRHVAHVPGYSPMDVWYWTTDPQVKLHCWITTWRDWALDAEVLHAAV